MDVEVREMEALVAVAEERSFTAAGRRLHLSQQSVSALIRRLETRLGVVLFDRTTRRVEPTAACEALVPELRAALTTIDRALARAREGAAPERPLRLAFTPSMALGPLQDLLDALTGAGLRAEIREQWADELPDALGAGRFDAALGVELEPVPGWARHPWRRQRVDVLVAATHPFATRAAVTVADLADQTIVLPEHRTSPGLHRRLRETFAAAGVAPTVVHSARMSRLPDPAVEHGGAVTIWLTGMDERHVPDGLVHVALGEPETDVGTDLLLPSTPGAAPALALRVLRELTTPAVRG